MVGKGMNDVFRRLSKSFLASAYRSLQLKWWNFAFPKLVSLADATAADFKAAAEGQVDPFLANSDTSFLA